jgi:hypothetical protein
MRVNFVIDLAVNNPLFAFGILLMILIISRPNRLLSFSPRRP